MKTNWNLCLMGIMFLVTALAQFGAGAATSETLSAEQVEQIQTNIRGAIGGIGLQMEKLGTELLVKEVFFDTPASKAGIKPGQVLAAINGTPTGTMKLEDAVKLCRGPVGSKVVLDMRDPGATSTRRAELVRDTIVFAGVSGRLLDSNAGLLTVTTFNQQTPRKVKAVLELFRGVDLRGLVLDLRENGGGSYAESCEVAGYFVGNAVPLWLLRQVGQSNAKPVQAGTQKAWDKPVVVLVSGKTAGSGELLASALQTSGRAKLLGQTTSGTASLRSLEKQPDGTSRKVEQAHFFTAQDKKILGQGIKPDITLEAELPPDELLQRAVAALPKP